MGEEKKLPFWGGRRVRSLVAGWGDDEDDHGGGGGLCIY
jgi:hypothetical protein